MVGYHIKNYTRSDILQKVVDTSLGFTDVVTRAENQNLSHRGLQMQQHSLRIGRLRTEVYRCSNTHLELVDSTLEFTDAATLTKNW